MTRRVDLAVGFSSVDAPFSIYINNDVDVVIQVSDSNGALIDLTGFSVDWILKQTATSATVLLRKKTADASMTILDQTTNKGTIQFSITAANTSGFPSGTYYQEMMIVNGSSKKTTVLVSSVTITAVSLPTV